MATSPASAEEVICRRWVIGAWMGLRSKEELVAWPTALP
ncbi:hypothetical protein J2S92_004229 [Arthrobacter bambusae]|nr:hypothetical protein [Arthrobacter bambusae]MDQ0237866.1 hypothetical protein [Arthrobacter bambusae]